MWRLTILMFAISISAHGESVTAKYTDLSGHIWSRWVLSEQEHDATVVLVIDNPDANAKDSTPSQKIVFRKSYLPEQSKTLQAMIQYYTEMKDHPEQQTSAAALDPKVAHKPLWDVVRNTWTAQDEKDYSDWYSKNVTPQFMVGTGVKVDCADFAMSVRWTYAHDHGLPAADTLAGTGKLFGQWSGSPSWDSLPTDPDWHKDRRFLAALQYVLVNTYTHSIFYDLYPTQLSTAYVAPGSILLILYSARTGHTEVVNSVGADQNYCAGRDCITVLYGNEPAEEIAYENTAWIENGGASEGGFMRWRWPALAADGTWALVTSPDMPGYSLEQYSVPKLPDQDFEDFVFGKLGMTTSDLDRAFIAANNAVVQLKERLSVTQRGYLMCGVQPCRPSQGMYDDYSTPSRDRMFRGTSLKFQHILAKVASNDPGRQTLLNSLKKTFIDGALQTFSDFIYNTNGITDHISPDPNDSFLNRWALELTDTGPELESLAQLWQEGWRWRETMLSSAQKLCYPHGEAQPVCQVNSAEILALDTSRLDIGLRSVRGDLLAKFNKSASPSQQAVVQKARAVAIGVKSCSWNPGGSCSVYDFLFSSHDMVDKMSGQPGDSLDRRYGF